jgi:hypothetical protein
VQPAQPAQVQLEQRALQEQLVLPARLPEQPEQRVQRVQDKLAQRAQPVQQAQPVHKVYQ